jgi:aminoglycoside phosphotransferase (APT) family kinase protein
VYRHTPSILVHDRLYDPSHSDTSDFNPHVKALVWPYLIQPFVHGEDLSKTFPEGSSPSILAETAVFLGKYLRHLHQIELGVSPQAQSNPLYEGNWKGFEKFLIKRRQTVTKRRPIASFGLSYKLQLELDDYIPRDVRSLCEPSQESFQLTSPRLLHGDMNENNVYLLDGKPYAVIDFGDCRMGDPHYDFVSVFVSSLRCHKGLLILCLQEYYQVEDFDELTEKVGGWQSFARIMMGYTLLHEQEMMRTVFHNRPDLRNIDQLELLEQALWNLGES